MNIELKPVKREELETLLKMQIEAFTELLEKYKDYDMSPAAESLDKIVARFEQPWTTYYFIMADEECVGAIRIVDKKDTSRKRISPIFIIFTCLTGHVLFFLKQVLNIFWKHEGSLM